MGDGRSPYADNIHPPTLQAGLIIIAISVNAFLDRTITDKAGNKLEVISCI